MKAVTLQGTEDVRVEDVPDPTIEQPTDAIVRITSTGLCGSDLHRYAVGMEAHVKRWHRLPLAQAPEAYERFQKKDDGTFKVIFEP